VFLCILMLLILSPVSSKEKIIFVAEEHVPYIGSELPRQGYVHQLVSEAFERVGYQLDVTYYPAARARMLASVGKVDGILPVYYSDNLLDTFLFSNPFPGDVIGLLKKKQNPANIVIQANKTLFENLQELSQYQFSLVRGSSAEQLLEQAHFLNKQYALNDLLNIDKLYASRMDFAVIDKLTAGDLIVSKRPHMIGQLEFIYPPLAAQQFHVAFNKNKPDALERVDLFNQGLSSLKADGRLDQILAYHGFYDTENGPINDTQKTNLVIGSVNNSDMLILQKLSAEFELLNPTIQLEWKVLEESTLRQRLLSDLAISAGQFDVMTIGSYEAPIWAENGWIIPVESLFNEYDTDDILANVKASVSIGDTLYALPFYAESSVMYYRSDLFKRAGIKMPDLPTYKQILEFAEKVHAPDEGIFGICLRGKGGWGANMTLITTMVNSYGGQWVDMQWRPQLTTKAWHDAITMYVKLVTQFGPPNSAENNYLENLTLFSQGKCGMWIDATAAASYLVNPLNSKISQQVKMTNAPIGQYKKGSQWLWTWSFAIPESSKHKDAALKFAAWATSKEYLKLVADRYGWLSIPSGTRKSIYQNTEYLAAAPFAPLVIDTINSIDPSNFTLKPIPYVGVQFIPIDEFSSIGDQVGHFIEQAIRKKITVDTALQQSQNLVEKQMRISGYYKGR
jgi:sorbitol/mannitol transport system substrate-binding protein